MNSKLIAYSMDFASYLIEKKKNDINQIILFGSVAREEADKDSDVDIFVEILKEDEKLENEIKNISQEFMESTKATNYWKLLGIKNEISPTVGTFDDWEKLKPSIIANGITLYGKFKQDVKGEHITFFTWENIKPESKRVLFNKQIFGYSQGNKYYEGMIDKYKGERLGKGCIVVPSEYTVVFHKLFKKNEITVKIKRVVEY